MKIDFTFSTIIILLVVIFSLYALYGLYKSKHWLETDAKITSLEVTENHLWNSSNTSSVDYIIDVEYTYQVNSREYTWNTIYSWMPNVFTHYSDVEEFKANYVEGKLARVYYNQDNPENSALKKVELPILFIIIVLLIMWWAWYVIYMWNQFISKNF